MLMVVQSQMYIDIVLFIGSDAKSGALIVVG